MIALGTYPTPVQPLPSLGTGRTALWVKRDDLTNASYGGNKVRKLERLLADAKAKGASRIVTLGAVGSHHVLATAIFARTIDVPVEAVLVPQPSTPHVAENLRADLGLGVHILPASTYPRAAIRYAARVASGVYGIPVGGSNVLGALAYVDAVRELAAQVKRGEMPEPDLVVVTLGSGGTAAGIAAGLALEGMRTKTLAITVSDPAWAVAKMARSLARRALRHEAKRLGRDTPKLDLTIDARYLGLGYGQPTAEGARAEDVARDAGLTLDPTYTAKTFAAVLDVVGGGDAKTVLYWHTLSSAPMEPWLAGAPAEDALPPKLRRLLRPS